MMYRNAVCAVAAIVAGTSTALGQQVAAVDEMTMKPWDSLPTATATPGLNDSLDLQPEAEPAPRLLRLSRRNDTVAGNGRVDSRLVADAVLRRSPSPDREARAEVVEWVSYDFGFGMGDGAVAPQAYPRVSEIAFDFVPGKTDLLETPLDVSAVDTGVAGIILQAMTLDAVTWDALLGDFVEHVGRHVDIGTAAALPEWNEARLLPGPDGSPAGSYRLGPTRVELAGVTRVKGEPAALLWFEIQGGEVTQALDLGTVSIDMDGREWFRGTMAVSLLDGRVVRGELWGVVVQEVETAVGDQPGSASPNTVLQRVVMSEIDDSRSH